MMRQRKESSPHFVVWCSSFSSAFVVSAFMTGMSIIQVSKASQQIYSKPFLMGIGMNQDLQS
jgi:hypothetical protein